MQERDELCRGLTEEVLHTRLQRRLSPGLESGLHMSDAGAGASCADEHAGDERATQLTGTMEG